MMFISDSPDEALLEEHEQPTIEDELFNRKDEDDFPPIGSIVATIFFGSLGGALVANIGLGNALVTFLSLSIFWKGNIVNQYLQNIHGDLSKLTFIQCQYVK